MPLFESTNLLISLLVSGSGISAFYAFAIAATNALRWFRYAQGSFGFSYSACIGLYWLTCFLLLVAMFPKPRHLRLVRIAIGFVLLPLLALSLLLVAVVAANDPAARAQVCFNYDPYDGLCEDDGDPLWIVCGLPAGICVVFIMGLYWSGNEDQLSDTKPQSARARVGTSLRTWVLLSTLFTVAAMCYTTAVPFLRFPRTTDAYRAMLNDFSAAVDAWYIGDAADFRTITTAQCTLQCNGCDPNAVVTLKHIDIPGGPADQPYGIRPFNIPVLRSDPSNPPFPNVTDVYAWYSASMEPANPAAQSWDGYVTTTCTLTFQVKLANGAWTSYNATVEDSGTSFILPNNTAGQPFPRGMAYQPLVAPGVSVPLAKVSTNQSATPTTAPYRWEYSTILELPAANGTTTPVTFSTARYAADLKTAVNVNFHTGDMALMVVPMYSGAADPRLRLAAILDDEAYTWGYEGPDDAARPVTGGMLVAVGVLATAVCVFWGYTAVYRKCGEARALGEDVDYSDVQMTAGPAEP